MTTLASDSRLCLCHRWLSLEMPGWWFQKQLIYLRKHSLSCDHLGDRVDILWQDQCSEKFYLQRFSAEIRRIRSRFRLASCALVYFEKIVDSVMTGHGQWTVVDQTATTWVSGSSCSTVILSPAYAVFHTLSAVGSAFLGNCQNKKVLSQSLGKNREKNWVLVKDAMTHEDRQRYSRRSIFFTGG